MSDKFLEPVPFGGKTVGVYDGDTVYETTDDGKINGSGDRLFGIDAPEQKNKDPNSGSFQESGAQSSADRLQELLVLNPDAERQVIESDQYGRNVVKYVTKDGVDLNEQLVREGHASSYDFRGQQSPYAKANFEYLHNLRTGAIKAEQGQLRIVNESTSDPLATRDITIGFKRGVESTKGFLNYGMSQMAEYAGLSDMASSLAQNAQDAFQEAAKYEPTIGSWKEAKETGEYATWVAGLFGEQLPQMSFDIAAGIATAGTGAVASVAARRVGFELMSAGLAKTLSFSTGAATSQYTQMVGQVAQELKANGINDPKTAMLYALPAAGLDYLSLKSMLGTAGRMMKDGKTSAANSLVAGVLKHSAFEGATEAAQEFISKTAVASHNSNFDVFSTENIDDYAESFMAGLAVGGAMTTVGGGIAKLMPHQIENQNKEILGHSESRTQILTSGEEPVTVTTTTPDGERMQEVARKSKASEVATKQEQALGEGAATVFESPRDEVMSRQTEGMKLTSNGDHVVEDIDKVASDIKPVIKGKKPAALSDKPTILEALASLDEATKAAAEANLMAFETEDERVILADKNNEANLNKIRAVLDKDGVEFDEVDIPSLIGAEGFQQTVGGYSEPVQFGEGFLGANINERAPVAQTEVASQEFLDEPVENIVEPVVDTRTPDERLKAIPDWVEKAKIPFHELKGRESHEGATEVAELKDGLDRAKATVFAADMVNGGKLSEPQKAVIVDYFLKAIASDKISPARKRVMIDALDADFDVVMDVSTVEAMLGKEAATEIEDTRTETPITYESVSTDNKASFEDTLSDMENSSSFGDDIQQHQREQLKRVELSNDKDSLQNQESIAIAEAVAAGVKKAVANRARAAVLRAKVSDFAKFGYASKEELADRKKRAMKSKQSTYVTDPQKVNALFVSADGKSTVEVYMPDAVYSLLKSGELTSTSDRNLAQRALDAYSAIVGEMALRPEMFYLANANINHTINGKQVNGAELVHVLNRTTAKMAKDEAKIDTKSFEPTELVQAESNLADKQTELYELETALATALSDQKELGINADVQAKAGIAARVYALRGKVRKAMADVDLAEEAVTKATVMENGEFLGESTTFGASPNAKIDRESFDESTQVDEPVRLKKDTMDSFTGTPQVKRKKSVDEPTVVKPKVEDKVSAAGVPKDVVSIKLRTALRDAIRDSGIQAKVRFELAAGTQKSLATVVFTDGEAVVTIDPLAVRGMSLTEEAMEIALTHEIGHVFVAETMHNISKEAHERLHSAFERAAARVPSSHPYNQKDGVGYDEWLSDQFGAYVRGKRTAPESATLFEKIKGGLAKFVNALTDALFGRERVVGDVTGIEFMHSMFEHGIKGKPFKADDKFGEWTAKFYAENAPESRTLAERRAAVEALATGIEFVPNGVAPRNMTVQESMGKASDIGKSFMANLASGITHPQRTTRRMLSMAGTLADSATFLRTADGELRTFGRVGERIANRFKNMIADNNADLHVWTVRAEKVLNAVPKEKLEAFAKGETVAPPELKKFFRDMYNYAKENIKDLGFVENDFVPRFYNKENIEKDVTGFARLLVKQASESGVALTMESAIETAHTIIRGETMVSNYIEERSVLAGPTTQHKKARNLHFVDDVAMSQAGFIVTDPAAVMASYVNHVVRRASYEKVFAGYNKLDDEDDIKRSPQGQATAAKHVLYNSIMFNPIWYESDDGKWMLMPLETKKELVTSYESKTFLDDNMVYLQQLAKRGVLLEPTKKKLDPTQWSYYDQNKHLRRDAAYLDKKQVKRLLTIVDAYAGRLGADSMSYKTRALQSNVIAYENLTVMGLAVFAQFADMAGMVFRNRDMAGAIDSLGEIRKLLFTTEGKERRELMVDLGFAEKQLSMQAVLEAQGLQFQTQGARKVNEFLFKYNGVQSLTNITRTATAAIAERFILRHAKKALAGDSRSSRYLRELGITADVAIALDSPDFKHYNHYVSEGLVGTNSTPESRASEAIHKAMFAFTDSAVVRPDASQRPVWASDPRFAIIWHLKSFMYAYGHTIIKGLYKEVNARYFERRMAGDSYAAAVGDAAVPLIIFLLPVFALSALGLELREKVQYELWGAEAPTDKLTTEEYMFEVLKRGGIMGAGELGYNFVDSAQRGHSGVAQLMGPTVSHLEVLMQMDWPKSIARSTPLINQLPPVREWFKGLFGG